MQKWEYLAVLLDARQGRWLDDRGSSGDLTHVEYGSGRLAEEHVFVSRLLEDLGSNGWELVTVAPHAVGEKLYFKRPR